MFALIDSVLVGNTLFDSTFVYDGMILTVFCCCAQVDCFVSTLLDDNRSELVVIVFIAFDDDVLFVCLLRIWEVVAFDSCWDFNIVLYLLLLKVERSVQSLSLLLYVR